MKLILASWLDLYEKDARGVRHPHAFSNANSIVERMRSALGGRKNFLFISNVENDPQATQAYFSAVAESFKLTLPFERYDFLDGSNLGRAKELIKRADCIYLCQGHLPTENAFFNAAGLKELLKNSNALIIGCSAGSMNAAARVYALPELEGEAIDPTFKRFVEGLGLTDINVIPHFDSLIGARLDGLRYIEDIIIPDSKSANIIGLADGSYIFVDGDLATVFGKAYRPYGGAVKVICKEGESLSLSELNK